MLRTAKCRGPLFGSPGHPVGIGHRNHKFPRSTGAQMPAEGCCSECEHWQGETISEIRDVKGASFSFYRSSVEAYRRKERFCPHKTL